MKEEKIKIDYSSLNSSLTVSDKTIDIVFILIYIQEGIEIAEDVRRIEKRMGQAVEERNAVTRRCAWRCGLKFSPCSLNASDLMK